MDDLIDDNEMPDETEICRFKLSSKLTKRAPVFIADFDHARVSSHGSNALKFEVFKKESDRDKLGYDAHRNLFARSDHLEFKGSPSKEANHFRNFIGVLDKKTGKMKLYDTVLFRMKPVVKSTEDDAASHIPIQKTYWEGINDLTASFGIKNQKRAMSERLKHAPESLLKEDLKMNDLSIEPTSEGTMLHAGSKDLSYLPQINHEASTVDQVFNMYEIITPEEQDALAEEAQQLLNADESEMSNMCSSFCKYVSLHFKNTAVGLEKAKYLIYLNYLVMFHHLKYNDVQRKDPAPDIPQPFRQRILDEFTLNSKTVHGKISRSIPPLMKDKLVSYILVLALFIDDFLVNSSYLLSDLNKVGLTKLLKIGQAMGCHVKAQKIGTETVKFVELKLPLFVLPPKFVKKSK